MKRVLMLLTALCMAFMLAACGSEPYEETEPAWETEEPAELSLTDVAGWWTKPEGYQGLTVLYTFCVDAENEVAVGYDDYGNQSEGFPCWYDDGFYIDAGELFGIASYILEDDCLLDSEGQVQYVRCDPIDPAAAPFSLEALEGIWHKNGGDYAALIFDGSTGYREEMAEIPVEEGSCLVIKSTTYYDASEYTGPAVSLEPENAISRTMWVLEEGNLLFDDFHGEYYIRDSLSDEEFSRLLEKYTLIRDGWSTDAQEQHHLVFKFFGELWLYSADSDGYAVSEVIGSWEMENGELFMYYDDGTEQQLIPGEEVYSEFLDMTFIRWPAF